MSLEEGEQRDEYEPERGTLWVDLAETFDGIEIPEVSNPTFDDALKMVVDGVDGVICGNNPRSVLLATYRDR